MALRKSPEADDDFARIYAYGLADYGRAKAEEYAYRLLRVFDMLTDNPFLGRETHGRLTARAALSIRRPQHPLHNR